VQAAAQGRKFGDNDWALLRKTRAMAKKVSVKWLSKPEDHDYPAALSYLSLIYDATTAASLVKKLKKAAMTEFKAKDIFRASALPLLGVVNSHVKKNQQKIMSGGEMTPLLLIRDTANGRVIIADGYHRMCAVYSFDEDAVIPCKIA
jgi:hypothetical protein